MSKRLNLAISAVAALVGALLLLGSPAVEVHAGGVAAGRPEAAGEVSTGRPDQVRLIGGLLLGAGLLGWVRAGKGKTERRRPALGRAGMPLRQGGVDGSADASQEMGGPSTLVG